MDRPEGQYRGSLRVRPRAAAAGVPLRERIVEDFGG